MEDADKLVISIQSNVDITVVTQNSRPYVLDAYMAIPVTYAADEFYVTTYCSETASSPSECVVGIVPIYSNTEVTFVMPDTLTSGDIAGKSVFQASETSSDLIPFGEVKFLQGNGFAGMKILSNDTVHVFVGNTMGTFYTGSNNDFVEEQLMPVNKWGLSYLVAKSSNTDDRIWITASKANTNVRIVSNLSSCTQYSMSSAGEYLDIVISEDAYYIIADKPVGITHFVLHTKGLIYTMYSVTPVDQFNTEAVTFVPQSTGIGNTENNFAVAVIFTNTNMTSSLIFDGTVLLNSTGWKKIPYSGMSVTTVTLTTKQTHTFQQWEFGGTLGGYVFGYDRYTVFAHALTVSYRNLETGCNGPCYDQNIYNTVNTCQNVSSTATVTAEGTTVTPEGTTVTAEGTTVTPEGTTITPEGTTVTPEITTLSPEENSDITTIGLYCKCSTYFGASNVTEIIEQDFQRMTNEMTVESKYTSKYRRRKTSADDNRASSKAIGAIFSFIIVGIVGLVIIIDVKQVLPFVHTCYNRFKQLHCSNRATVNNVDSM